MVKGQTLLRQYNYLEMASTESSCSALSRLIENSKNLLVISKYIDKSCRTVKYLNIRNSNYSTVRIDIFVL